MSQPGETPADAVEAAPAVSMFLLALFVIVGRWPR
jgi:hypothetical protein